jgi:hypothetical protein
MKNIFKLIGIIAFVAVIWFSACDHGTKNDNDSGGTGGGGGNSTEQEKNNIFTKRQEFQSPMAAGLCLGAGSASLNNEIAIHIGNVVFCIK